MMNTWSSGSFEALSFDNTFSSLPPFFFESVEPTPLNSAILLHHTPLKGELGLQQLTEDQLKSWLNGQTRIPGDQRISTRYAGHQFGVWAGQLGDGRAISLGELLTPQMGRQEIQMKGLGITPFSRRGDGKAVLRSSIREYLCAEAMHALGIPTTRSLAILTGDGTVEREEVEFEAAVARVFPTQIRFGHFEMAFHFGRRSELHALIEYTRKHFFQDASIEEMLESVLDRTARMIALWQSVGFCHGVMNTDNMSILGLTLDYGPFGFMEDFNPHHICNRSDSEGRYAYSEQPKVGMWNLERLFVCFSDLLPRERLIALLESYPGRFKTHLLSAYRTKLGLAEVGPDDLELLESLFDMLTLQKFDYTFFFRCLSRYEPRKVDSMSSLRGHYPECFDPGSALVQWLRRYDERLLLEKKTDSFRATTLLKVNPKWVLRNPLLQEIIAETSSSNTVMLGKAAELFRNPFREESDWDSWADPLPEKLKNRILSCSS